MSGSELPKIKAGANVATAAKFMLFWDADAVEVYSDDAPTGTVSQLDLVRFLAGGGDLFGTTVDELLDRERSHGTAADDGTPSLIRLRGAFPKLRDCTAGEIMTTPAVACREDATVDQVVALLADREVSGLSVVDENDRVVGVISERDLSGALGESLLRLALHNQLSTGPFLRQPRPTPLHGTRAADIMSTPPIVADPATPMHVLAEEMAVHEINRIPVVSNGRLIGIVTRRDVLAAVAGIVRRTHRVLEPVVIAGPSDGRFTRADRPPIASGRQSL